jgi:hypothetical protein
MLEEFVKNGVSLEGFELRNAILDNISLGHADLRQANLTRASLIKAHLHDADLRGARLIKTQLKEANLNQAKLENANLLGIQLEQAKVERVEWGKMILQEKKGREASRQGNIEQSLVYFTEAEEIYRALYKLMIAKALHHEVSFMYYKHRLMKRYQLPLYSSERFLSYINDLIGGYGEDPIKTIVFCLYVLLFFSLCYIFLGLDIRGESKIFDLHQPFFFNGAAAYDIDISIQHGINRI